MIPADSLVPFLLASTLLGLAPGPDNLFVLTQSMLHGRIAGILITLGLCTGIVVHTAAVALGVAAIIQATPLAYTALKAIGATYLLYLAWQAFRAATNSNDSTPATALGHGQLYRRGILMNVTNPKVTLFFLAFLPQFTDPAVGLITVQIMQLGLGFIGVTLVVFGGIALLAGGIGQRLTQYRSGLNRLAGLVFLLLAAKLLLNVT